MFRQKYGSDLDTTVANLRSAWVPEPEKMICYRGKTGECQCRVRNDPRFVHKSRWKPLLPKY